MALSPKGLVCFWAGISGRNPRLEGCLPKPVLEGSRGRVPFLRVLVVFAGAVWRRVLVRLADVLLVACQDPPHHREVPAMERLEPADEEAASRHSDSSPIKCPLYGQSSVRNLRQWMQRPSSWTDPRAALTS